MIKSWKFYCIYFRGKDQPSTRFGEHCTKMSVRLSEEHKWESVQCSEETAVVAVCQYQWKKDNESQADPVKGI